MAQQRPGDGLTALVTGAFFRARAGTGKTRLSVVSPVAASMPVAEAGYRGWRDDKRVVVTGARNKLMAGLVPFMPRRTLLRVVRHIQGAR